MNSSWFYLPTVLHLLVFFAVRKFWRAQGWSWSVLDTAMCIVLPFIFVLFWLFLLSALIHWALPPLSPDYLQSWTISWILFLPPLLIFWAWFLHAEYRRHRDDRGIQN
jgi:hypothetical protein